MQNLTCSWSVRKCPFIIHRACDWSMGKNLKLGISSVFWLIISTSPLMVHWSESSSPRRQPRFDSWTELFLISNRDKKSKATAKFKLNVALENETNSRVRPYRSKRQYYTYCTGAYTCFHIVIETDLGKSSLCAFEQKQEGTVEGGGEKSEKGPLCTAAIYQARVGQSRPYIV